MKKITVTLLFLVSVSVFAQDVIYTDISGDQHYREMTSVTKDKDNTYLVFSGPISEFFYKASNEEPNYEEHADGEIWAKEEIKITCWKSKGRWENRSTYRCKSPE